MPQRSALPVLLLLLVAAACRAPDGASDGGAAPEIASGGTAAAAALALFPFEDIRARRDGGAALAEPYFAAGVRQELLTRLAVLEGLRVVSPSAPDLAVGHGVHGRVEREGSRVEVRVAVTRLPEGDTLWRGVAEGERRELSRLQAELVEGIAGAVGRELTPGEREAAGRAPTSDPAAHDLYLRGHALGRRGDAADQAGRERAWRAAVPLFEEAVARDPGFARAWAGLAFHHLRLHWFRYDHSAERLERAREALERAEALDPDDPEVLLARGYWHYWGRRDYARAMESYRAARARLPGDARLQTLVAYVLRRQGEMEEAARLLGANSDLDPTDAGLALEAGDTWHALGRWDEARRYLERARGRAPEHPGAWLSLGWLALGESGDTAAARRRFDEGAGRAGAENFLFARWRLAMLEGDGREALALADEALGRGTEAFVLPFLLVPVEQMAGFALRALGREDGAARRFRAASAFLERVAPTYGDDHRLHRARALTLAALAERAAALAAADRGVAALPVERDAFLGGGPLEDRAWVRTLVGDVDGALDDLERIVGAPSLVPLTPALLRLDPRWDPLRNEPRFRSLTAE